jgi:hypothetical protein
MTDHKRKLDEEQLIEKKMTIKEFVYRLFFTREDSLDVLQLLFTIVVGVTLMSVWKIITLMMSGSDGEVVIEALKTLRWLAGLLVITAVPSWMVPIVAKMRTQKTPKPLEHVHDESDEHAS